VALGVRTTVGSGVGLEVEVPVGEGLAVGEALAVGGRGLSRAAGVGIPGAAVPAAG
jgi:hypothetical protein